MAWNYGFFNSVNGDRTYTAEHISRMYEGMISNGVFASVGKELVVEPNNGMTIQINTGRGHFNNHWVRNDSEHLLVVADADVLLNRYAAVCIRVDDSDDVRSAEPYLKYGSFATVPAKPEMEHSEKVDEFCLAYVYIPAGASEIKGSYIEDARGDNSVCGWVHVLMDQVETSTLWQQYKSEWAEFMQQTESDTTTWQATEKSEFEAWRASEKAALQVWQVSEAAAFEAWFNGLEVMLEGDVAANLANETQKLKNQIEKATGTITASGWDDIGGGVYQQTVAVGGVTVANDVFVTPEEGFKKAYSEAGITAVAQGVGSVTFETEELPTVDIQIKFMVINDVA